jgi:hypothetical protein
MLIKCTITVRLFDARAIAFPSCQTACVYPVQLSSYTILTYCSPRFSLTWSHSLTLRNGPGPARNSFNGVRVQEYGMAPPDLNTSLHWVSNSCACLAMVTNLALAVRCDSCPSCLLAINSGPQRVAGEAGLKEDGAQGRRSVRASRVENATVHE